MTLDDALQHQQIAVGVLLLAEEGEGDRSCSVVHGPDEREPRPAALQPVVSAAVDLQRHALLRVALPAGVALARPSSSSGAGDSSGPQDPPNGGAGEVDALSLCQHLRQVRVVETGVVGRGKGQHPLLSLWARGGRRFAAPVPVSDAGNALLSISCQQSPGVALAHSHQRGRRGH